MAVTLDDVRHIAALARLGVDADRLPALAEQLSAILGHMEVLQGVDVSGAGGGGDDAPGMALRPDGGVQRPLAHPRESFAPLMKHGFFLVPRLATHEDDSA
jgi:aspartyl-tRNA(Asn)/glutamyl-tRNA(Gln) amidotransferase subunit C